MLTTLFRGGQALVGAAVLVVIVMVFDEWKFRGMAALAVFGFVATIMLFIRRFDDKDKLAGRLLAVCAVLWAVAFGIARFVPAVTLQVLMGTALGLAIIAVPVVDIRAERARNRNPA